jgi:4-diphosphocytidyl-2-C-methyl-D-erythritol kinase
MIRIQAPAKVNLGLRVLAREESGYHSLETVFCAVSLFDEIAVDRARAGVRLEVEGDSPTAGAEENIVVRAARRFMAGAQLQGGVRMRLRKRIPVAAGLGGGSADAAATLLALDALAGGSVAGRDLLGWGAELGSDVPFFLCGSPLALAWGRGERLLALPPLPSRPVLIGNPGIAAPTGEAFRRLAELRGDAERPPAAAVSARDLQSWDAIAELAVNDFEGPATERIPVIGRGLRLLRDAGAGLALLSGSGASIFGIFADAAARDAAEPLLRDLGLRTWRAETLQEMPLPARDPTDPRRRERLDPLSGPG